jgi:hypothetical protein
MILRRVIDHVKHQNWTAVALDFVIVVMGVFIGIQVSNWNEARKTSSAQSALLERLDDEFEALEPVLSRWVDEMQATTASTAAVVNALRVEAPPNDLAAFRKDLAQANFVRSMPALPANYIALVSSGGIASIENDRLRVALIRYGDAHAQAERFYPAALAAVFDPQANYFTAVLQPGRAATPSLVTTGKGSRLRARKCRPGSRFKTNSSSNRRTSSKRCGRYAQFWRSVHDPPPHLRACEGPQLVRGRDRFRHRRCRRLCRLTGQQLERGEAGPRARILLP